MVGGEKEPVQRLDSVLRTLAPGRGETEPTAGRKPGGTAEEGFLHCGPVGSGHFVKMIHNGIEYGMMQALAEGFALMHNRSDLALDVAKIGEMWRHGSVVRSWLLDLIAAFLAEDAELRDVAPIVADSGEGRWTVQEAIEQRIAAPVLSLALMARFTSQGGGDYANRMLAMMRKGFGGHGVASVTTKR